MTRTDQPTSPDPGADLRVAGTGTVLWVLWATYGSFYFCRINLAAALPGIEQEFGYTKSQMANVLIALKIAYGIGQFVNGQLADRVSPRLMLSIGMVMSAGLNVWFGTGAAIWFFGFVWALNGYSQSFGWTPTMRVAANWLPPQVRGKSIGIIGTGYMVGASLAYVVSGFAADSRLFGWRGALYVPSAILLVSCVHMLILLREKPPEHAFEREGAEERARRPLSVSLRLTLGNPALWLLALALGLLNACRYGYLDWGISLIHDVQGDQSVGKSAIKFAILPAGGILGSLGAGWATDRFFGGRRAPMICTMLVALALLSLWFRMAVEIGTTATVVCLFFIGIAIYGPQVLLVGTAPADLARGGAVAASVGFVNFMGYMGAAAGDKFTGILADADKSWKGATYLWAVFAAAAAGLVAVLWRRSAVPTTRGEKERAA